MQKNIQVEKEKIFIDGVEIPGLVEVGELKREKSVVEVPSFNRIREVQSNIVKNPRIQLKYAYNRTTHTLKYFEDSFDNNEVHDVEIVRTDAHGVDFSECARAVYTFCEINSITKPKYDAANPTYASVEIELIYFDRIRIA
jgi:hypothetical protein